MVLRGWKFPCCSSWSVRLYYVWFDWVSDGLWFSPWYIVYDGLWSIFPPHHRLCLFKVMLWWFLKQKEFKQKPLGGRSEGREQFIRFLCGTLLAIGFQRLIFLWVSLNNQCFTIRFYDVLWCFMTTTTGQPVFNYIMVERRAVFKAAVQSLLGSTQLTVRKRGQETT